MKKIIILLLSAISIICCGKQDKDSICNLVKISSNLNYLTHKFHNINYDQNYEETVEYLDIGSVSFAIEWSKKLRTSNEIELLPFSFNQYEYTKVLKRLF